jgi:hypothetical protein
MVEGRAKFQLSEQLKPIQDTSIKNLLTEQARGAKEVN